MRPYAGPQIPQHFINLTRQVVSERVVRQMLQDHNRLSQGVGANFHWCNPEDLWRQQHIVIAAKVEIMHEHTLGGIVAWATPFGLHRQAFDTDCEHNVPDFINRTGFLDVCPYVDVQQGVLIVLGGNTREVRRGVETTYPKRRACLETLAAATIICILRDIIMQEDWQNEAINEKEGMVRLERGGKRTYGHPLTPDVLGLPAREWPSGADGRIFEAQ